jgi:hypothetical protein
MPGLVTSLFLVAALFGTAGLATYLAYRLYRG